MSIVIINATAIKTSGALTVLNDFVSYIEKDLNYGNEYHLFTVVNDFYNLNNIQVHKLKSQTWLSRIWWDNGGLQKWCNKIKLEPDVIISLQNTSTKYKKKNGMMIVQLVYYHQPIPLYNWNEFDHSFKIILYHYFYPFFVRMNNVKSHYVVQIPYMKELFCKKFKNISPDRVTVIYPCKPRININAIMEKTFFNEEKKFVYLYPATSLSYKNHVVLISALVKLGKNNPDIQKKIIILFTVDALSDNIMNDINLNNLGSCLKFIGQIQYKELLMYYKMVDALLFPSKMESFGFPLLEGSCFGLPIIACNLPYAKEVLVDYNNKYFIDPDDVEAWADAICEYKKYSKVIPDNTIVYENSWKIFIDLVDKIVLEQRNE